MLVLRSPGCLIPVPENIRWRAIENDIGDARAQQVVYRTTKQIIEIRGTRTPGPVTESDRDGEWGNGAMSYITLLNHARDWPCGDQ